MKTRTHLNALAVALAAVAGCSPEPGESVDGASTVSPVIVTSSTLSTPSAAGSTAGGSGGQGGTPAPAPSSPATSRPLSDFADGSADWPYYSFGTPSGVLFEGHIQCRVVDGSLFCHTEGHSYPVADDALCGSYPGLEKNHAQSFELRSNGPCATIIQGEGFISPHTLAYGQSVTAELSSGRTVTCTSTIDGLTCTQTGGTGPRGFLLTVDSFTIL
jgi:hypothetical protein